MHGRRILPLVLLLAAPALHAAKPATLVRVPKDAATLQVAISRVANGGAIEMSAGTYASPTQGFKINNASKGFTVRAAPGARVVIEGGGSRRLLQLTNSDRARGKLVTFEGITFQNGFSPVGNQAGGVTLDKSEATFRSCSFVNNRAAAAGGEGAAAKATNGASARFESCSFRGNTAQLGGGALAVRTAAVVTVQGGEFVGNRTNLPAHHPNAYGGAIAVVDGTLNVSGARFQGNQAAWVGGAIYAIGNWDKGSNVSVTGSSFIENQTVSDPCCNNGQPGTGGALHAEDQTTLRVQQSVFVRNRAQFGGAVDGFRSVVEISGSVFQGNQTTLSHPEGGVGGAILVLSNDSADASTGNGAINRRPARLVVTQSLLQGGSEITTPVSTGGCIFAGGDAPRVFGGGTAPPAGTPIENRATVELRDVVLADCDVATSANRDGGTGGALIGDLIDLTMEDSLVMYSDARGANGAGGAINLRSDSAARILRSTFASNSADLRGGALSLNGSIVEVHDSRFFGNDVVPGGFEAVRESRGAAIFSTPLLDPARFRNAAGVVSTSSFVDNLGVPIFDVDPQSGPINDMRYDGNRFGPNLFGDLVYVNSLSAPSGIGAIQLNALTVDRGARGATRKSLVANEQLFSPHEGALVLVPSPNGAGAGPSAPGSVVVAFAWAGGAAQLNGQPLTAKAGLLEVPAATYTLTVDGVAVATAKAVRPRRSR